MDTVLAIPRIITLFDSTCDKQFQIMDCDVLSTNESSPEIKCDSNDRVFSLIDAQNDDLIIHLQVNSSRTFLESTMPVENPMLASDVSLQDDWNSELANRFICRLKNKLIFHGCNLKMGLPEIQQSSAFDLQTDSALPQNQSKSIVRCFEIKKGSLSELVVCSLRLDLLKENMSLNDYEDEDEDWFPESEIEHL